MAPAWGSSLAIYAGTCAVGSGVAGLESRKEMEAEASLCVGSCEILGKLLNLSEPVSSSMKWESNNVIAKTEMILFLNKNG